jgi:predicted esterase
MRLGRREFNMAIASLAVGSACRSLGGAIKPNDGRLTARPGAGVKAAPTGELKLERDAILQLPDNVSDKPLPLLVMLHGATQRAGDMFRYLGSAHKQADVAVLAPNSAEITWDAIHSSTFGEDVDYLDRVLKRVFETAAIDPSRVSVGGFSDGATYALSLGLINGDFFKSIVAFSPGFVISGDNHGKPRIFISHGTRDHILPIDRCGRRIAGELRGKGYDVTFREFDGDHEIPKDVAREGLALV